MYSTLYVPLDIDYYPHITVQTMNNGVLSSDYVRELL